MKQDFKKFLPLIYIFLCIFLFTFFMILQRGLWDTLYAMRMFEGAFFVVFGGFKVLNWKGFVDAYQMYDVIAQRSRLYAYLYPLIEITLGILYFINYAPLSVNLFTLGIMIISTIGVTKVLLKKEEITCACLGVVFKVPMTKVTFFEDVLMAVMAFSMFVMNI